MSTTRRPGSGPTTASLTPSGGHFPTKDGHIGLLPYTDEQWVQFFEAAGWGERFTSDPRFKDQPSRVKHLSELYILAGEASKALTTAEWLERLKPLGIPVVKTNRLDDLPADPHLEAVRFLPALRAPPRPAAISSCARPCVTQRRQPTSAARPTTGRAHSRGAGGNRRARNGIVGGMTMSDMRVRQIALVAENLDPVVEQLGAVFGLKVGFRDPRVGFYGLVNVVMPVGGEFLEVVQPIKDDASAGRLTGSAAAAMPATWSSCRPRTPWPTASAWPTSACA